MIRAEDFLSSASALGFRLFAGVPCSYLKPFINYVIGTDSLRYVAAANEGDAVAIAAGSELGGVNAVCMFQNSGLGNAVSPLSSLTHTFEIPILLIVTHRGEPGAGPDEPQHELMGRITPGMLDLLEIPWERFPTEIGDIEGSLTRARLSMQRTSRPFALIMSKGSVEPWPCGDATPKHRPVPRMPGPRLEARSTRHEMLVAVRAAARTEDVLVATTGYTGRELFAVGDAPNQFYVVGSMGCASSLALGIALAQPQRRVIVLDGDGSAIMRLGALTTIGKQQPPNLVHVLLDNGAHESTGGQRTVSDTTDLAAVAAACDYGTVTRAASPEALEDMLTDRTAGLRFIHAPIHAGIPESLPRPSISPPEVAARLRKNLATACES